MDAAAIEGRLRAVESFVGEICALGRPAELRTDIREQRFVEHTLQMVIRAAQSVAAHIIADQRLGEPRSNGDLFERLVRNDWLPDRLAGPFQTMTRLQTMLVYEYDEVDLAIVEDVVAHHLDDLLDFAQAVRARLAREE